MTDPFEHFDAAYVLGALSDAERTLYEEHLETCEACAAAVAELVDLPARLAVLDADDVLREPEPVPDTLLPALLRAAGYGRRRTRVAFAGLALLAAAAVIALLVVVWPSSSGPGRPPARAMQAVAGAPVSASVRLVAKRWGTEVDVHCRYTDGDAGSKGGVPYELVVYDRANKPFGIGSWKLDPGQDAQFTASSRLTPAQISKIAIEWLPRGVTVLSLAN